MSNEDQLTEIDALESIFGEQFSSQYDKRLIKVHLQPYLHEDETSINHVTCDVYIIFGHTYPQTPLYQLFIEAYGMDPQKRIKFQQAVTDIHAALTGTRDDQSQTIIQATIPTHQLEQDTITTQNFFSEMVKEVEEHVNGMNIGDYKQSGTIYIFELLDGIREWLIDNNVREAKSLRDTVDNIEAIDEANRLKDMVEEVDDEPEPYCDPYDTEDNVFLQEYDSGIACDPGQLCTAEIFAQWSEQFLKVQNERRIKSLIERGLQDDTDQLTGKQLFLSNMVSDLMDDDTGGSAFTYVREKKAEPELVAEEELDIDESLFDFSDDDDDDDYDATGAASPAIESTSPSTSTQPQQPQQQQQPESDKKSSSKKDKKDEKDKKDDKKDKKASKDTKAKKGAGKKGFEISGGFDDFLGGSF